MQRSASTSERTPLVQPTYVFESSISRSYQKRLRNFQCIVCIILILVLSVTLLVTVGYNLGKEDGDEDSNGLEADEEVANLTVPATLLPLLTMSWPLKGKPPASWEKQPSPDDITTAVSAGKEALMKRKQIETTLTPLPMDTPAARAQRAAATSAAVKPLAETAFAVEHATRVLANGTDPALRSGGVGVGPSTNGSFTEPAYCRPPTEPCVLSKYRTQDGTCNNLEHPLRWGVSNTPFRRALPPDYGDGISSPRLGVGGEPLPSARDVSVTVHRPSYVHDTAFTVMLAVWGQFVDHDITATALSKGANSSALSCCNSNASLSHPECFPVRLDEEDPFYQDYNLTCMEFVRSAPAPTCHFGVREQMNQATAFIDASTVYGFAKYKSTQLRLGVAGQLKMLRIGPWELLPPSTDPNDGCNTVDMTAQGRYCFESGDDRANENLHLTTMHLIWARQHNRVAASLTRLNPLWDDETVFQETRRILGAQMQHITYAEFLPSILGVDIMWALNMTLQTDGYSSSYDPSVDPSIANHFSAAAFRFAHTLLPGLIRHVDSNNGSINYVHLHEMLFNPYALYRAQGARASVDSAISTPVHSVDPHVTTELSNHLFERPVVLNASTTPVKKPGPCGLDLISLNIQRGRDHGLPPYPAWRELCGLSRPQTFDDLKSIFDEQSLSRISNIYKNVDDIDLYTGALAEKPRGRLLGPTLTCLVADQFLRLKVGDRFWYETGDPLVAFTEEQLAEIRKTTLGSVICANEDLLDFAQPRVMEAPSAVNPLVACKELPQPSFKPWKTPPQVKKPTTKPKTV
ncbi:peroxidase [Battus philenor]|uniref:peroxidase n=1 Tax=Battus philenor TaxID=42288 RepID=UPI0035CF7683